MDSLTVSDLQEQQFDGQDLNDLSPASPSKRQKRSAIVKQIRMDLDTNERQEQYVSTQKQKGDRLGLVFAKAFLYGMRDIGYKSPGWALSEMVDNSIQAGATTIEVRFGFDASNKSKAKPDMLAVIDNGAGMIPEMIGFAVRWGGSDRVGDRQGFGRYGYGLPSSAVSIAKRYTVYSKTVRDGNWYAVTVDLDELADAADDVGKLEQLLEPHVAALPAWIASYARWDGEAADEHQLNAKSLKSGTVVVLEDIDRLRKNNGWITTKIFKGKLLDHFGLIYRHWLHERRIRVDGVTAQVVDPLFLMPEGRYYAETAVLAKQVYDHAFEVETSGGEKGVVRIRAALLPPNFQWADPDDVSPRPKNNKRQKIMKAYNGLLVCREGRQIDCITPEWTKFQVYDYNVKLEIDFDPVLDEFFGITTSKQQIVVDEVMWEKLKQTGKESGGLYALIRDMRAEYGRLVDQLNERQENAPKGDQPRPSELAMEEAERFRIRRATPTPEKIAESKKNLEEVIEKIVKETGASKEEVEERVKARTEKHGWEVQFESVEDGPFYRPRRLGTQKQIIINTSHHFYTKVYNQAPAIKSALEVLLFVLADGEIDAEGDREQFYRSERVHHWSKMLKDALEKLVDDDVIADRHSAIQESTEADTAAEA